MILSTDNDGREDAREDARDEPETAAGPRVPNVPATTTACPFAPSPELFHPPRLGIIHLLAWTAASAVLMKIITWAGWLDSMPDNFPGWMRVFFTAISSIHMAVIAAGVVGTCVIVRSRYRGHDGRLQAGHWMVINMAGTSILSLVLWLPLVMLMDWLMSLSAATHSFAINYAIYLVEAVPQFLLAVLWLVAAIRMREAIVWKATFGFLALRSAAAGCVNLLSAFFPTFLPFFFPSLRSFSQLPIGASLTLLVLSAVVLADFNRHTKRDWLHGLGVAMLMITSLLGVAQFIAIKFFPPP